MQIFFFTFGNSYELEAKLTYRYAPLNLPNTCECTIGVEKNSPAKL